jgi:hypothetical protein
MRAHLYQRRRGHGTYHHSAALVQRREDIRRHGYRDRPTLEERWAGRVCYGGLPGGLVDDDGRDVDGLSEPGPGLGDGLPLQRSDDEIPIAGLAQAGGDRINSSPNPPDGRVADMSS